MLSLVPSFTELLQPLPCEMTTPTFDRFLTVVTGRFFCRRHPITGMILGADAVGTKHHSAYHRLFCLPVLFRLQVPKNTAEKKDLPYHTKPQLAVRMLQLLCGRFEHRRFHAVGDSAYGGKGMLLKLPDNCDLTSRMTRNARLDDAPANRRSRRGGRPRNRGGRLAILLYTLVVLWFSRQGHRHDPPPKRPWDIGKTQASFADRLATLRCQSVKREVLSMGLHGTGSRNVAKRLLHVMKQAASV